MFNKKISFYQQFVRENQTNWTEMKSIRLFQNSIILNRFWYIFSFKFITVILCILFLNSQFLSKDSCKFQIQRKKIKKSLNFHGWIIIFMKIMFRLGIFLYNNIRRESLYTKRLSQILFILRQFLTGLHCIDRLTSRFLHGCNENNAETAIDCHN